MKISMIKKRLEPLVHSKQDLKEYIYEVLEKGKYLFVNKDISFSYAFFELYEKSKKQLFQYFNKMNYKQTYIYDDKQIISLINEEDKYCFFRHNNEFLNPDTFSFEGVASFETEYLAKGEIFSIMDTIEKYANEVLNISLVTGKDLHKEEYRCYSMISDGEMIKVGEISYDFNSSHTVQFKINFNLIMSTLLINSDDRGLVLPAKLSTIDIVVFAKNKAKQGSIELCEKIQEILSVYNVFVDQDDNTSGYKSALYDLRGIPFKIISSISDGEEKIIVCNRLSLQKEEVKIEDLKRYIDINLIKFNKLMLKNNRKQLDSNIELIRDGMLKSNKVNIIPWCGENCFNEDSSFEYLIPFHQLLSSVPCHFCGKLNKKFIYIFKKSQLF